MINGKVILVAILAIVLFVGSLGWNIGVSAKEQQARYPVGIKVSQDTEGRPVTRYDLDGYTCFTFWSGIWCDKK